jgi:hypothetical protein
MIHGSRITTFCIAILLSLLPLAAIAAELTIPNSFSNGEPADADQVNANFEAVRQAVNENNLKDGGVVNGPLTVPAVTYSPPKSASVTYSAMGFTADKSQAVGIRGHETEFEKTVLGLKVNEPNGAAFYHCVSLRSVITITHIRAHVQDTDEDENQALTISLMKKELNQEFEVLASVTTDGLSNSGEQILTSDAVSELIDNNPVSYFIEVLFRNTNQYLHSVTIDFTYTEP